MAAVVAVGGAIISAIGTAVVAVASAIAAIVSAVAAAVSAVAGAIYGAVSAAVSALTAGISAVAAKISSVAVSVASEIGGTLASWSGTVVEYAKTIYGAWQSFAEAIHLKTILTVHDIAYLVSKDYRQMINKVYRKFSEISKQLGLGAEFITLALQNARSVVMDVSMMMGKSYDLAQITWLKSLGNWSRKFEEHAERYEENPGLLLNDIDEHILRDTVEAGAGVQKTVLTTIDSTVETVNETVQDVVRLRDDIDQFVSDLPKEIREEIKPYVDPVIDRVDGFLEDEYRPFKKRLDKAMAILDNKQKTIKNRTDSIVDRLTRPGDVLKGVDSLPVGERIIQENKVSEVASRSSERQADNLEVQAKPTWEHLEKLRRALEEQPPAPEYEIKERKKPIVPAGQQSKEADTWFVGDY